MTDKTGRRKQQSITNRTKERQSFDSHNDSMWFGQHNRSVLAIWTINDQKKLLSLNNLYRRSMEFHQNVHSKESPLMLLALSALQHQQQGSLYDGRRMMPNSGENGIESVAILANVITFSADKSKRLLQQFNYSQFYAFCHNVLIPSYRSNNDNRTSKTTTTTAEGEEEESSTSSPPSKDYYWIHIKDTVALEILTLTIGLHELIYTNFFDLRGHSSILQYSNELFVSNIVCSLEEYTFHMYKIYLYMKEHILVSYEAELFPNIDTDSEEAFPDLDIHDSLSPRSDSQHHLHRHNQQQQQGHRTNTNANKSRDVIFTDSMIQLAEQQGDSVGLKPTSVDGASGTNSSNSIRTISTTSPFTSTITDKMMQLFFKHITRLKKKVLEMGVFYLIYEISLQLLSIYDSPIEHNSAALSYFDRVVHLNLLHRERLNMMMKIHLLQSGISLLRKSIEGCAETFSNLLHVSHELADIHYQTHSMLDHQLQQGNSTVGRDSEYGREGGESLFGSPVSISGISPKQQQFQQFHSQQQHAQHRHAPSSASIKEEHSLFLTDIRDAYIYKRNCLQKQNEEIRRLESELDAVIQLRTTNTNTMLSLIATTFLPMTFFAGVFGMNFTESGGYTMTLLNEYYGPNIFIGMCLACFVFSLAFFIYQGWLEFGIFAKIFKKFNRVKIDDSSKLNDFSEKAIIRAEEEELKRKEEQTYMRSSYSNLASSSRFSTLARRASGSSLVSPLIAQQQQPLQQPASMMGNSIQNNYPRQNLTTPLITPNNSSSPSSPLRKND